jgi:hypothetical protein
VPQAQRPLFPAGATPINDHLACLCRDGQVTYLNGHLPVFTHAQQDLAAFRLFTCQLIVNGSATQGQIVRAFGVPKIAVKRAVQKYRTGGAGAFFQSAPRRAGSKLTPAVLTHAQALLEQGLAVPALSTQLDGLATTLHKAIGAGRLRRPAKKKTRPARRP